MEVFAATANQMLTLFVFIAIGFGLNKKHILPDNTSSVLSKLETYIFVPCLIFTVFLKYCTIENLRSKCVYMLYGLVIMVISLVIGTLLAKCFAKDDYVRRIYTYSFAVSNFSFMGNAVVLGVFGEAALFDYMIFTLPLYLYTYSIGTVSLIPVQESRRFRMKALINPIFVSLLLGIILGLIAIPVPRFIMSTVESAGNCMSPCAMLLTGFVIGNYKLKDLASNKKIYLVSILRLVIIPVFFVIVLSMLRTDKELIRVALCATAMPLGLNTVVFPAAYGGDTTPGASMALISHAMSVMTIPLIFAILVW